MATLKVIRQRIASFKTTQKSTRAMKLISAAKLRRAQESLVSERPYSESLKRIAASLLRTDASPAGRTGSPAALMVVVGSDRGLCGAYNGNLLRRAEDVARELKAAGVTVNLFAIGRKTADHFRRTRQPTIGQRIGLTPKLATLGLARELAALMLTQFRSGEIREAGIVYSHFRSALSQQPTYERVLPTAGGETASAQASPQPTTEYLIEPSRERLVSTVLQSYVESTVFHALLEAEASEQGARMTAMDAATNNAADMIDRLTLEMNRARQAQITRELMDIVGGAEALRG